MLVIYRVKLYILNELQKMRKLERSRACRGENFFYASDEIVQVRHMRYNVVANYEVGFAMSALKRLRRSGSKKNRFRWNARLASSFRHILGGLYTKATNLPVNEVA